MSKFKVGDKVRCVEIKNKEFFEKLREYKDEKDLSWARRVIVFTRISL